ncbi:MAG: M56 family metallopeptidase, partial [Methylocella sp.]
MMRALRFQRRLHQATLADDEVKTLVRSVARRMGLRNVPQAWMLDGRLSPMVWCGIRPRLILPTRLWDELDDAGRRTVLFHELAHLRRRDHWVSWIEIVVGCIYWWHPLVWWVRHRIQTEADHCCDAWVTNLLPGRRRVYAEALLKTRQFIDERCHVPVIGMGMTTVRAGRFARRLTMVMTGSAKPSLSLSGVALAFVMAAAGWLAAPAQSCPRPEAQASAATPAVAPIPAIPATPATTAAAGLMPIDARAAIAPLAHFRLVGDRDGDDRFEELERKLDELSERLDGLSGSLGDAPHPRRPAPPCPPRPPHVNPPPPPLLPGFGAPPPPGGPMPGPGQTWADMGGEKSEWRLYKLSRGKLGPFTDFMSRPDVPIRVRPNPDGLEMEATPAQHGILLGFLQLIDPCSERAGAGPPPGGHAFAIGGHGHGPGHGCDEDCKKNCKKDCKEDCK